MVYNAFKLDTFEFGMLENFVEVCLQIIVYGFFLQQQNKYTYPKEKRKLNLIKLNLFS